MRSLPPEVINNIILAIIAIANAVTAYLAFRNHNALAVVRADIGTIEKATNSMKDALVAATNEAGEARGYKAGQAAQIASDSRNSKDKGD